MLCLVPIVTSSAGIALSKGLAARTRLTSSSKTSDLRVLGLNDVLPPLDGSIKAFQEDYERVINRSLKVWSV